MNLPLHWVESPPSMTAAEAGAYCAQLAKSHYENFHVATFFLPRDLHQDFYNLYAYCRWSDDLADETGDRERSLHLLELWERQLDECYAGHAAHPVFQALAETAKRRDVPAKPFHDLLRAFVQDQQVRRYPTYADLDGYCVNSANPVGRLVLYLCGYRDEGRQRLADFTCTALQLANFWQDVIVDYAKDRIYIPLEDMTRFGCTEEHIARREFTPRFRELMRFEVDRARGLFAQGLPLVKMVDKHLSADLDLFSAGGLEILKMIEAEDYNVLKARPSLGKFRKLRLLATAAVKRIALVGAR